MRSGSVRLISAQPEVTLEHLEDHICAITLQRPSKQNAIGQQLLSELCATLDELANAPMDKAPRAVIVRSSVPGIFCAGGDFKEMAGMSADELKIFIRLLRGAVTSLEQLPMPTIAVIAGGAFGGGAELALGCDLRVGGEQAQVVFPETLMGMIPALGGTQRLPRLIGHARAKDLILSGRAVAPAEALRIGLFDRVGDGEGGAAGSVEALALGVAREIAARSPLASRAAKRAIDAGAQVDLGSGMEIERACYTRVWGSRDQQEGFAALGEKRAPVFEGS